MKLVEQVAFILKNALVLTYTIVVAEDNTKAALAVVEDFRKGDIRFLAFDATMEHISIDLREVAAIRLIYQEEK